MWAFENGSVTGMVGGWLAAQSAGTIHAELDGAEGPRRWQILRACVQDMTKLRHGAPLVRPERQFGGILKPQFLIDAPRNMRQGLAW